MTPSDSSSDQTSTSESEHEGTKGPKYPNSKRPIRRQLPVQIEDIEPGALEFYDKDVDVTIAKDLEKRGLDIHGQIEELWPKDHEIPPGPQSSQFQGIFVNFYIAVPNMLFYLQWLLLAKEVDPRQFSLFKAKGEKRE